MITRVLDMMTGELIAVHLSQNGLDMAEITGIKSAPQKSAAATYIAQHTYTIYSYQKGFSQEKIELLKLESQQEEIMIKLIGNSMYNRINK